MRLGVIMPIDGASSLTIRTLRKFIQIFKKENIELKFILTGSVGHFSNELDKLNIEYKTLHSHQWIYPAYPLNFDSDKHTSETFEFIMPIALQLKTWSVDAVLSISLLNNTGAVVGALMNKPHIWFINENLINHPIYKGYFDIASYQSLIKNHNHLIFDSFSNFFSLNDTFEKSKHFIFERIASFENQSNHMASKVDIIIPFYNDKNIFKCIEKIKEFSTDNLNKIIIVIDHGPDEQLINEIKERYSSDKDIIIIENDKNYGFVHACNVGMEFSKNDVVILNSDTIPTKFWLRNLQKGIYSDENIMTASPLSNNIGDLSIPSIKENQIIDENQVAEILNKFVAQDRIEVHSSHGFCMYIKRKCLDQIGKFNEKEFGSGYGEENEFCLRVREENYKNILVGNSFVKHLGTKSFTNEIKLKLKKKNSDILKKRYPFLVPEVLDFIRVNPLAEVSKILDFFRNHPDLINKKYILISTMLKDASEFNAIFENLILEHKINFSEEKIIVEGPMDNDIIDQLNTKYKDQVFFIGVLDYPDNLIKNSESFYIDPKYRINELSKKGEKGHQNIEILTKSLEKETLEYLNLEKDLVNFIKVSIKNHGNLNVSNPFYSPIMLKHFMKKSVLKSVKAYIVRSIEHNKYSLKIWIKYNKFKKLSRKSLKKSRFLRKLKSLLS